jgi:HK97 family phage major capsid protein
LTTYNSLTSRSEAAALIPEDAAREIIQGIPEFSAALRTMRTVRMTRAQQRMPALSALPVAYWVDSNGSDTALKQTSEIGWENKYLDVRELAVIIVIPEAVIDDSDFDIWGETVPRLREAFGSKIDAATLMNVDNPWPNAYQKGISRQAYDAGNYVTEGHSVATGGFIADISDTWAKVEEDGFDVNIQYARRKVRSRLRGQFDTTGQPVYLPEVRGSQPATVFGEPLEFVSSEPWVNNYEMVVGDRNQAIIGIRQDFSYKIFTEGVVSDDSGNVVVNLMQQDAIAMRAVGRFAFAVANPINRENASSSTRFPFAVLINAGS